MGGTILIREGKTSWTLLTAGAHEGLAEFGFLSCLVVVLLLSLRELVLEVTIREGYKKNGWMADYGGVDSTLTWANMLATWAMLSLLAFDRSWMLVRPALAVLGCCKWFKLLWSVRGLEVCVISLDLERLTLPVLPLVMGVREVVYFMMILLYFMVANLFAGYALDTRAMNWTEIAFSTFRLALLGDFEREPDILFVGEGEDPPQLAAWHYVLFCGSTSLFVALLNIFVGVMGNAYDFYSSRASELFARSRAEKRLGYALRSTSRWWSTPCLALWCTLPTRKREHHVWFCYSDGAKMKASGPDSFRAAMQEQSEVEEQRLAKLERTVVQRFSYLEESISMFDQRFSRLEKCLGKLGLHEEDAGR